MRIHVINLDRDPGRFAETLEQFDAAGLKDSVVRVPAIDAQATDFASPGYAPHRWLDRWELKLSERAVFESHRSVWQRIADGEDVFGIVCEDDILVSETFPEVLVELDFGAQGVVKLDGFSADRRYGDAQSMGGRALWDIVEPVPSAACYAVSKGAAHILLRASEQYCATLDDFVFAPRAGLHPVQLVPAIAVQRMCCIVQEGTADTMDSTRESRDQSSRARGPIAYRLRKEIRRGLQSLKNRSRPKLRPTLANDLPGYGR
ncbi:glycosyltransferase family 25 protein [Sedimentitalea todarodis]|uniref:Glycosyltransferase family 25 protein n=1 Tax=Sedimentitalea todarodis TaxID=1631240 RepID=A0ABU3VJC4_9RHOB|nr:glycosyltransferase family 25 protein [Sedimentitalea todarodis]MDU9006291.1 glycosyltransferase family 25 protein [Sedimentitalea todarodis]